MTKKRTKAKPDTWMPFYIGDFLADTAHLTTEQRGALMLILFAMWKQGGRFPNAEDQLATITGLGTRKWRQSRAVLMPFFQVADDFLYQKRLTQEYEHAWAVYAKRVASGQQGGRPVAGDLFEGADPAEGKTERLPERPSVRPPQLQPQPQASPDTGASEQIPEEAIARPDWWAKAQALAQALAAHGHAIDPTDPRLEPAIEAGVTAPQLTAVAKEKAGKPLAYVLQTAIGRKQDGQQDSPPTAPPPTPDSARIRVLEDRIIEARHMHEKLNLITKEQCAARVASAQDEIRRIAGRAEAA